VRHLWITIIGVLAGAVAHGAPRPATQPTSAPASDRPALLARIAALERINMELQDQNRAMRAALVARKGPDTSAESNLPTSWPAEWVPSFKNAEAILKEAPGDLDAEVRDLKEDFAKQDALRKANGYGPPSADVQRIRAERLANLRVRQQSLLDTNRVPALPDLTNVALGEAGHLTADGLVKILQVLNEHEFRGQLGGFRQSGPAPQGRFITTFNPPMEFVWREPAVLFRGVDTKAMADGTGANLRQVFIVTGTRQFETTQHVLRTEFVLEPLDEKAWKAAYLTWKQRLSAPTQPADRPPGPARYYPKPGSPGT